MPQLKCLDEFIVMDFERSYIAKIFTPENIKREKLKELDRFRPFNKEHSYWKSTDYVIDPE